MADWHLAVVQGTDFIRKDSTLSDLTTSGNDRPFLTTFPFIAPPNPLPGETGTQGFGVLGNTPSDDGSAGPAVQQ